MLKAVVMDMDGTLLNEENKISNRTREYLISLQKKGVKLVLASGRSYTRLLPYARQLKMDEYGGWLIEVDGIAVYDVKNRERTKFRTMDPEEIRGVFTWLTGTTAESQAMFDDGLFDFIPDYAWELKKQIRRKQNLPEDFPWTAGPWGWLTDFRDGYPNIMYIKSADEISRPLNKIQLMDEEDRLEGIYRQLQEKFGHEFSIYRTTPRQLEILPLGFSKGRAVRNLMESQGWQRDEVAVFGDGENDVAMFDEADYSYAMDNAKEYVKQKARFVCPSNREDGIVQALVRRV
ncbi:MAG: HAD family hydrolase [Erysipelotrichaceae bacterium]|nr:HAD family hydrolase [Erysipelotrichaceae bacterium]